MKAWLNFEGAWLRQGKGSLAFEGRKEAPHVEGEISNGVIVSNRVDGTEVYALLSRVWCDMGPDLLQKMEYLSTSEVCGCSPFLRSGAAEEYSRKEVEVYAVSAEAMPTLVLRKLYGQISIPALFP
jgi:hypothetical protein